LYDFFLESLLGLMLKRVLQWNAYYYDANANGMMDGSESLSDHCLNMNLKILKMLLVS
jgi:hypothetical protein